MKIHLIAMLRDRVGELCKVGNFDEARHAANAAVERAEVELCADRDSILAFASALEVRADFLRVLQEWELARDDYKQAIDQLEAWHEYCVPLGRLHAGLGAVHDALGNTARAIELWQMAIRHFEKATPPALLEMAAVSNNLAFLKKSTGDLDGAENAFLKALEIMHKKRGTYHEETASVCNNLGALYLQSGFYEQAREMHHMALDARKKCLGDAHVDTAQSYNNLALALIQMGDKKAAVAHFENAISGLTHCGASCVDVLQDVGDNYISYLMAEGEQPVADLVKTRIAEIQSSW